MFKTLWGAVGADAPYRTFDDVIAPIADDGFDGVHFALIARELEPEIGSLQQLGELCQEYGLGITTLVQTSGNTVGEHLETLRSGFEEAAVLDNRHLVCHGGRDAFDDEQAATFFTEALAMEKDLGLSVAYETHRLRVLYNPWATVRLLERFDDLKLALDFSHWVVVAERLLDDELELIRQTGTRAIHIDARVGHPEGPQVPDPRAPEWEQTLEAHLRWWDIVWEEQERQGLDTSIVVPEFGPPPYQQTLPYTGVPTTDLWEVCNWMASKVRHRFGERNAGEAGE